MVCIEKQQGRNQLEEMIEEKKDCDTRIDGITGFICAEHQDCYFCSTQAYMVGGQLLSRCGYFEIVNIYKQERKNGQATS
jgi:hypothetical protein